MTVEVSKLTAFGLTGASSGVTVSKLVAYVLLAPGTESGVPASKHYSYTYAQRLKQETD
jgi:hypothetical protein